MNATTKITKLTTLNVSALEAFKDELKVTLGKTTAEFEGTNEEAATRVRQVQEKVAAKEGRKGGTYSSLHAVARKLENSAAPGETVAPEKAVPTKKAAPAKKTAGTRGIPTEAVNKARQAWISANGIDTYRKQYNGGWDNATYGTGARRAGSGEASPAWMDGYTDRTANPGKEGIKSKWAALRSDKAPVKKVQAPAES